MDRRHGTERALAELLERLAGDYHCEIHIYSQHVEEFVVSGSSAPGAEQGGIVWHKVPPLRGPELLQFVFWLFLNSLCRAWDRRTKGETTAIRNSAHPWLVNGLVKGLAKWLLQGLLKLKARLDSGVLNGGCESWQPERDSRQEPQMSVNHKVLIPHEHPFSLESIRVCVLAR